MSRCLWAIAALLLTPALFIIWVTASQVSPAGASNIGYGLIVGDVKPCAASDFDTSPANPLIVILTRDGKTFATYNVSADSGTTSYHFDVPTGPYSLTTTYLGGKTHDVVVKFGVTTKVNLRVTCKASGESTTAAAAMCGTRALTITTTNGDGLHHGVELIKFTNVAASACTLRGYPEIDAVH